MVSIRTMCALGLVLALGAPTLSALELHPARADLPLTIDGVLDEAAWENAELYENFVMASPDIGLPPAEPTRVRLAHDAEHLYFGIRAEDREATSIKSAIMGWDGLFDGDWVGVYVDALNDSQGAWGFFVNAHGSQGDRLLSASNDVGDNAPDNVWQAAATLDSLGYTVEIAIPLRSLRYDAGDLVRMGVGFVRHISRRTEYSHFPNYSPFAGTLMSQLGQAEYEGLGWKRTWELLPSAVHVEQETREGDTLTRVDETSGSELGLTGKVGVTPTLTLDMAINPDFSQVEADAGQIDTNLRSLVFYPEKRPFFQEGSDYFQMAATDASAFGSMLHTRNIVDPRAGFRLTGKLGPRNVVGVLYADEEAAGIVDGTGRRAAFAAARYRRQLDEQSYVGSMYTMRRYRGRLNQVAGLDGFWRASEHNTLQANGLLSHTRPGDGGDDRRMHHLAGAWLYRTRSNFVRVRIHDVSKDFDLDSGFVPRDGTSYFQPSVRRYMYPNDVLQNINAGYWSYVMHDKYEEEIEQWHNFFAWFTLPRSTGIGLWRFFGNELYSGGDFEVNGWYATAWSQLSKSLRIAGEMRSEGKPRFSIDPYQGDQRISAIGLTFEPGERLRAELSAVRLDFRRREGNSHEFDDNIFRLKTTLQLSRYFFLRLIGEYRETDFTGEPLRRRLQGEFLASFNYLPGTVLYAGYGSLHQSGASLPPEQNPQGLTGTLETERTLFFKASYNWRI